jgi:hypothetical protein
MAADSDGGEPLEDQAFAAAANAYAQSPGHWERAVGAAIAALFRFLANRPGATTACVVEHGADGRDAVVRRDRLILRFTVLLDPAFESAEVQPPEVVAEAIGGGIYEIVRGHAREGRLAALPDAIPDAIVVALSPFVGPDAAAELASSTNVQTER